LNRLVASAAVDQQLGLIQALISSGAEKITDARSLDT
jgi:hypothetical protein